MRKESFWLEHHKCLTNYLEIVAIFFLLLEFSTLDTPENRPRKAKEITAGKSLGVILPENDKKSYQ